MPLTTFFMEAAGASEIEAEVKKKKEKEEKSFYALQYKDLEIINDTGCYISFPTELAIERPQSNLRYTAKK